MSTSVNVNLALYHLGFFIDLYLLVEERNILSNFLRIISHIHKYGFLNEKEKQIKKRVRPRG